MKVFVTGGTGYVGAAVVRRLLADGHEVRCLVRQQESWERLRRALLTRARCEAICSSPIRTAKR